MFKIDELEIKNALLLAPMEDVTDIGYRKLCKELGADIVYTEFVNSDGLIRNNKKTIKKLKITNEERPVGIQIYGQDIDAMVESARIAEEENPEIIDINAGCNGGEYRRTDDSLVRRFPHDDSAVGIE